MGAAGGCGRWVRQVDMGRWRRQVNLGRWTRQVAPAEPEAGPGPYLLVILQCRLSVCRWLHEIVLKPTQNLRKINFASSYLRSDLSTHREQGRFLSLVPGSQWTGARIRADASPVTTPLC